MSGLTGKNTNGLLGESQWMLGVRTIMEGYKTNFHKSGAVAAQGVYFVGGYGKRQRAHFLLVLVLHDRHWTSGVFFA